MPNFYIDEDEWYPVFSISSQAAAAYPGERLASVSDDEFARLRQAFSEFEWAQEFLRAKARD